MIEEADGMIKSLDDCIRELETGMTTVGKMACDFPVATLFV